MRTTAQTVCDACPHESCVTPGQAFIAATVQASASCLRESWNDSALIASTPPSETPSPKSSRLGNLYVFRRANVDRMRNQHPSAAAAWDADSAHHRPGQPQAVGRANQQRHHVVVMLTNCLVLLDSYSARRATLYH